MNNKRMEAPRQEIKTDWLKYDDAVKDRVVILSEKPEGEGIAAYWRKGRKYCKETRRYEDCAYWADLLLSNEISFKPKFYKER